MQAFSHLSLMQDSKCHIGHCVFQMTRMQGKCMTSSTSSQLIRDVPGTLALSAAATQPAVKR